ncbi:MHYT domain-containing protein [Nocardia paucivorans]|uniref:MHYT domain-containing protein n=1 Tax=Nocardia paucivorans TaxID=114259 RepID=UPI000300C605|nr:MHYT domain-containing protein [Nocardia paucivorans]
MADTQRLTAASEVNVELFTMGYWLPVLVFGVSVVGMTVGLACGVNARRSIRFRPVWVAAAAVAIGGVGIWVATVVSLLGLSLPGGDVLRYDPGKLITSGGMAVLAVFVAMMIAGREFRPRRLAGGAVAFAVFLAIMLYEMLDSVDFHGRVEVTPWLFALAVVVGTLASSLCLWLFQVYRFPLARIGTVMAFALGVIAYYHLGVLGLEFIVDESAGSSHGQELFGFAFPAFVVGMLSLAVPITAVLVAPDRRNTEMATVVEDRVKRKTEGKKDADTDDSDQRDPWPTGSLPRKRPASVAETLR